MAAELGVNPVHTHTGRSILRRSGRGAETVSASAINRVDPTTRRAQVGAADVDGDGDGYVS
jgi:hypothetical protein